MRLVGSPNPFPDILPAGYRYGRVLLRHTGARPERLPLMWEEDAGPGGDVNVLFYDGHLESMSVNDLAAVVEKEALQANIYRPTGEPPDWAKVRADKFAGHPEALFGLIGMAEREVTHRLGPPRSSQDFDDGERHLYYDFGEHDPDGPGYAWTLIVTLKDGRCDRFGLDD
jgi:prepilin-type processing-associated H-X9-DG protein